MLTLTYYGAQVSDVLGFSSLNEQIPQVLERYVERMLARGNDKKMGYSSQATRHWLAWLARQLQQRNQRIFHLERMQPDYLEGRAASQRYTRIMIGLIFSILGIVLLIPSWVSIFVYYPLAQNSNVILISSLALLSLLVTALMLGLVNGVLYQQQVKVSGASARQKWKQGGQRLIRGIVNLLLIGLFFGISFNYILRYVMIDVQKMHMSIELFAGFSSLLASGEHGVLLFIGDWLLDIQTTQIQPAEIIAWSWSKFWRTFFKFLGLGLLCDLLLCLLLLGLYFIGTTSLLHIVSSNQTVEILAIIVFVLAVLLFLGVPFFALLKGLTSGISTGILDPRDIVLPNQGIRR
jgi:hypothetical protein